MAQVWLVTGSSRGLGRAIVEAGLAAGNKVLATARDIESLHDLSERHGDQIKLFALDVTDESAAASAVKAAQAVVRLTQEQKPPLRLLLGSDAYNGAEKNDLARLEEARSWKELSLSTDFESKPPHSERPK